MKVTSVDLIDKINKNKLTEKHIYQMNEGILYYEL